MPRDAVRLAPLGLGYGFHDGAPGAPEADSSAETGYGFFEDALQRFSSELLKEN